MLGSLMAITWMAFRTQSKRQKKDPRTKLPEADIPITGVAISSISTAHKNEINVLKIIK
jgi:hypothetical protein